MNYKLAATFLLALLLFTACDRVEDIPQADTSVPISNQDKEIGYNADTAISILLGDGITNCSDRNVEISGDTVTIHKAGTYLLSGELSNGQIIVDAEKTDEIQLVLDGVALNCDTSAAIYVKKAEKVYVTLARDAENILSTAKEFVAIDENNIDGVIFSKSDLTLNGAGRLTIDSACGHGIVSKDNLTITSGVYAISAAGHAISGKDSICITDGSFTLSAGKDGLHADNSDAAALGSLQIFGGDFAITSDGDGMSASSVLTIENGTISVLAGGGSENGETHQESPFSKNSSQTDTTSTKGIKSTGALAILGGTLTVDASDDAIHSNDSVTISGGELRLSTGDDGIHADANVCIDGGTITVSQSYEGVEGQTITIRQGTLAITASDDGLNAAGGTDGSGFGGMRQDVFASDENCFIQIDGGTIQIDAEGDGIDSNGNLYVTGGETYVSGPTNSANGALDYNGEGKITGGIVIAAGASGMAQNFGSASTQGSILMNFSTSNAGAITLKDNAGTVLVTFTPEKAYSSIVVSCPQLTEGETYTLYACNQTETIELTSLIYGSGGMGGFGGGRPGNMQLPEGEEFNGQMPQGGKRPGDWGENQPPDGFTPQDGFMPPDDFTPPEGFTPPDGTGKQPPEGDSSNPL